MTDLSPLVNVAWKKDFKAFANALQCALMIKRELEALLVEARKGNPPSLVLIHGDDFQVHAATKAILDILVPEENRAFNLERFDGQSTQWVEIEASLRTPPFFSGKKTVWVENAPYFLAREHRGELGERVLQLWREGKREEAAKLFLDLLFLQGWSQEEWDKAQGRLSPPQVTELFGVEGKEVAEETEALCEFCRSRGIDVSHRRVGDGHKVLEVLEQGVPPWDVLLLTASHVDRRAGLYRRFEEKGTVLDLSLERQRGGRISHKTLAEFLDRRLRESGKRIEQEARQMIFMRAGDELWALHQELEKLLLYMGDEPWIKLKHVEEVFLDQGEAWVFDLTDAIAGRDALRAFGCLGRLLSQGEHPLRLLGTIASEVRRLLSARSLIEGEMRHKWSRKMSSSEFQTSVLQGGEPLLTRSPYGDYLSFKKAENFKTRELLRYLELIYKTDMQLKSTSSAPRLLMERLILELCRETENGTTWHEGKRQNRE